MPTATLSRPDLLTADDRRYDLDDVPPAHEMTAEEFAAYDQWNSELELAAGMTAAEQAEFDKVWEAL